MRPVFTAALAIPLLAGACRHVPQAGDAPDSRSDSVQVGYGSAPRRDVAGAVATLDVDATRQSGSVDVADMISGRFAGVEVRRLPGGGASIRIRGSRSVMGDNEPLYVVDGIPQRSGVGGNLLDLDPQDIKSIEVLKGAAASVYGSRGANGVILIATGRPVR